MFRMHRVLVSWQINILVCYCSKVIWLYWYTILHKKCSVNNIWGRNNALQVPSGFNHTETSFYCLSHIWTSNISRKQFCVREYFSQHHRRSKPRTSENSRTINMSLFCAHLALLNAVIANEGVRSTQLPSGLLGSFRLRSALPEHDRAVHVRRTGATQTLMSVVRRFSNVGSMQE